MFKIFKKKIKCVRCGKKVNKDFDYCPYCGYCFKPEKYREQRFKDFEKQLDKALDMPFLIKFPFKQLVKQFEKQIDAQMRDFDKALEKQKNDDEDARKMPVVSGLSISISNDGQGKPIIKVRNLGRVDRGNNRVMTPEERVEESAEKLTMEKTTTKPIKISDAKAKKFSKLPKSEPEAKVRRLTDRVVYEIALPGVKSVKDIMINKLDNSIEIKAYSKDKAYFKLIPISLPIKKYSLDKETLVLELIP